MKTYNHLFLSQDELSSFLQEQGGSSYSSVLVQLFCGIGETQTLATIIETLQTFFPHAVIIGASTSGEIYKASIYTNTIVVSLTFFEQTELIPLFSTRCDFACGVEMGNRLLSPSVKGALFFSEGINGNPEDFLSGIESVRSGLIIAGGAAADNGQFVRTMIIHGNIISEHGVTGVAFNNANLFITQDYSLGWNPIGRSMEVTRAKGPLLYELDGQPILEVLAYYFGEEVVRNLPASIVEFPLLITVNGIAVARAPIAVNNDGSLTYAGNFEVGQKVKFGIVDVDSIEFYGEQLSHRISSFTPESLWIYSCMGRKAMLGKTLEKEFSPLNNITPVSGFFTYGEFYQANSKPQMLNITTTVLALAEMMSTEIKLLPSYHGIESPIKALSRLVNTVSYELERNIHFLEDYRHALDANSIVSKTDLGGRLTYVNDRFVQISGYSREELIGSPHNIVRHPDTPKEVFCDMWQTIKKGEEWHGTLNNRKKTGETYTVDSTIIPLFDNGVLTEYIAIRHDITKLKEQERLLREHRIDVLTGLPNRLAFTEEILLIPNPIVALVNIDRFREINRFYGYEIGDKVINELAKLLAAILPSDCKIYKNNGDSFLICAYKSSQECFYHVIEQLLENVKQHMFVGDEAKVSLRLSVGVALGSEQIFSRVEEALHKARLKRVDIAVADKSDEDMRERNFFMLRILKEAIEHDRVIPFFQKIADLKNHDVLKYEVLMRIADEEGKIYTPYFFLDLAKKTKLYPLLTEIMIDKAFNKFQNVPVAFSLNLSMEDISNKQTVNFLEEKLRTFVAPERVIIELTESESVEDYEHLIAFMERIKKLGATIAIDDFGSGYSNFSYLIRFKADYLKIDGSIVREILDDESSFDTLKVIVELAHKLGMKAVAEFVSSQEIYNKLRETGVDYVQGYYIGEPMPVY